MTPGGFRAFREQTPALTLRLRREPLEDVSGVAPVLPPAARPGYRPCPMRPGLWTTRTLRPDPKRSPPAQRRSVPGTGVIKPPKADIYSDTPQLVAAGENIDRLGSEASFVHLCATAPVPASSGRTSRHRLNFAGNRAANRALHMIVPVRLRYCEQTRSYMDRRLAEGKTKKEAIRCLKRFVAREPYRTLRADLATLTTRT